MTAPYQAQPADPAHAFGARPEKVVAGLVLAVFGVLGGIAITVVIWRLGYVAAIGSLAIAFGAAFLYEAGAGQAPRKGVIPLVVLIVGGVFASFLAVVASDLWDVYDLGVFTESRSSFILAHVFDTELWSEYGSDAVFFVVFAIVGVFGVLRRLLSR